MVESERRFFGHPRGLAFIVFTEAWERFSFYGMQALLVLYMAGYLLHPGTVEQVIGFPGFRTAVQGVFGLLSTQALASQIFGLYVGMVYFMPVFGGLIGDRVLGQRRAVMLGAVSMAIGHFLMAFEAAFLFALLALIVGSGLLKGNLAAQVGKLYAKTDPRRESGFSIYCLAINVGAFIAPLVCGNLSCNDFICRVMRGQGPAQRVKMISATQTRFVRSATVVTVASCATAPEAQVAARAIAPTCNREMGE